MILGGGGKAKGVRSQMQRKRRTHARTDLNSMRSEMRSGKGQSRSLSFVFLSLHFILGFSDDSKLDDAIASNSTTHTGSSSSSSSMIILIILIVAVLLCVLSFMLFKWWRKKRREEQYARLLKLFEEDDDLELELGLRD